MSNKDISLPAVLPWRSFRDEGEIDDRGIGITVGYNAVGPSPEVCDINELASLARQLAAAYVHLGTGDMAQWTFHRIPAPEPPDRPFPSRAAALVHAERRAQFSAESHWLTLTRLYLTHQYESPVRNFMKATLFATTDGQKRQSNHELLREYALNRFEAFRDAASNALKLTRLSHLELFRDLLMTVTYHEYPAALPESHVRLNEIIGCERFVGGYTPYINGYHLRPLCISAYPAATVPQILAVLLRHPGRMTVGARFICRDPYDARRDLEHEKQHWNREILGTVWKLFKSWMTTNVGGADQDTATQLADINSAIAAAAAGMAFGWGTVTAVIRDKDPERADLRVRDIQKQCHALGIMARIEDIHAVEAVESTWPANGVSNIERILMTGANFADVTLPADHWPGLPYIDSPFYPEQTPTPLVCGGTGSKLPFYFPTHVNGVANQLIIGPIGTGKSTLLATMAVAYLGVPDAHIIWLDLDQSSYVLAHLMADISDYREPGSEETAPLCPLTLLDQPGGLEWLFDWFSRIFRRWDFEPDERQAADLTEALETARDTDIRTITLFLHLIQDQRMREVLKNYGSEGKWANIFDGQPDTMATRPLHIFELRTLISHGKRASAPAIELILHSIVLALGDRPVWIFADEFWALLADEVSSDWLFDAIRTFRKKKAGFVGCTQSLTEILSHRNRDLLLESCPGKILLPNHEANGEYVRDSYHKLGLNAHEIDLVANAQPYRQYYFRCPLGSRLFTLDLGPYALAICAATGRQDVQQARRTLDDSPNGHFLDAWLSTRVPNYEYQLPTIHEDNTHAS